MEKATPHSKLSVVKVMVEAGKVAATASAFQGARELGINDLGGMCVAHAAIFGPRFCPSRLHLQ
jgi:motility quorum-sensing regulator / GCU-specific mRNA interferase toxin